MKIAPLADRIVVKRQDPEVRKGLIFIPETGRELPMLGEVRGVGPGRLSETGAVVVPHVKEGDIVLFGRYAGIKVTIDDEEVLIMREDEILARVIEK